MPLPPSELYEGQTEGPTDQPNLLTDSVVGALAGGVQQLIAPAAEVLAKANGETDDKGLFSSIARAARYGAKAAEANAMSEGSQRELATPFLESAHPVRNLVLKGASSLPFMAAAAVTGPVGGAVLGGLQGAGARMSEVHGEIEDASDEDLAQKYPQFDGYLSMGFDSKQARSMLADDLANPESVALGALGGAAGMAGFGAGKAGAGVLRRAIEGAGHGAAGMGVMGGANEAAREAGEGEGFSTGKIAEAVASGAIEGSVFGGVLGGAHGVMGAGKRAAIERVKRMAKDKSGVPVGDGNLPTAEQRAAAEAQTGEKAPEQSPEQPNEPTALDKMMADAAANDPDAASAPPNPPSEAPPAGAPPSPAPTTAPAAPDPVRTAIKEAIHSAATKRIGLTDLVKKVSDALSEQDGTPYTAAEIQPIVREMKATDELSYNRKTGYKTTRPPAPKVEAPKVEEPNIPGRQESEAAKSLPDLTPQEPTKVEPNIPGRQESEAAKSLPDLAAKKPIEQHPMLAEAKEIGRNSAGERVFERPDGQRVAIGPGDHPYAGPASEGRWQVTPSGNTAPKTGTLKLGVKGVAVIKKAADVAAAKKAPAKPAKPKPPREVLIQKRVEELRAQEKADYEAEKAQRRAEGKPVVLRTPESVEAQTARLRARAEQELVEAPRAADAARKRAARSSAAGRNEERAQRVLKDVWADETGKINEEALSATDAMAAKGDEDARRQILQRAKNAVTVAKNEGVAVNKETGRLQRTTWSKDAKDVTDPTPHATLLHEMENAVDRIEAAEKADPKHRETRLKEAYDHLIAMERAVRAGKFDEAAALRLDRNLDVRKGKDGTAALEKRMRDAGRDVSELAVADEEKTGQIARVEGNERKHKASRAQVLSWRIRRQRVQSKLRRLMAKATKLPADEAEARFGREYDALNDELDYLNTAIERRDWVEAPREGQHTGLIRKEYHGTKEWWDAINGAKSYRAKDLLQSNAWSNEEHSLGDLGSSFLRMVRSRLLSALGDDTRVVVLPDHVFDSTGRENTLGVQYTASREAQAGGHSALVVLREGYSRETLVHELVHAVTVYELHANPAFRAEMKRLMELVESNKDALRKVYKDHEIDELYAFENEMEFVAEALSNSRFQEVLHNIPVTDPTTKSLWGHVRTAWDYLKQRIMGIMKVPDDPAYFTMMDAVLRAAETAMDMHRGFTLKGKRPVGLLDATPAELPTAQERLIENNRRISGGGERAREFFDNAKDRGINAKATAKKILYKIMTVGQLADSKGHLFEGDQAQRLYEARGRMERARDKILKEEGGDDVVRNLASAERKFTASGYWQKFVDLLYNSTARRVFPDRPLSEQKHLGKEKTDSPDYWAARRAYADLATEYSQLPAELQALYRQTVDFGRTMQNRMAVELIQNTLREISPDGKGSMALAQLIHEGKLTDAQKKALGETNMQTINDAMALSKIEGPYAPLMRRGDYVVQGRHDFETPANGIRMNGEEKPDANGNVVQFKTREEAKAFVHKLVDNGLAPEKVQRVTVDPKTNSRTGIDEDGKPRRLTKEDEGPDAVEAWRVHVQDKHVEFHEKEADAIKARQALLENNLKDVAHVDLKRNNAAAVNNSYMPQQITNMINALQKRKSFQEMHPEAQRQMIRHLHEQGLRAMATTRAQTKRLPRTNVQGFSKELTRNTQQYANSVAGYLARLKYQPQINDILKAMNAYADKMRYAKGADDGTQADRRAVLREFEDRMYGVGSEPEAPSLIHKIGTRMLQMSYLDKLASPGFHIINSTEPWTISLPVLAARHGMFKTASALHAAYKAIGAPDALLQGAKDTARALRNDVMTDYLSRFTDRLRKAEDGAELIQLLRRLSDVGLISPDAGLELGRVADPSANAGLRALDRADFMARQLGTAIESINRSVTGIASYRLARGKGLSHEQALTQAVKDVHDTMGDYTAGNAPPIFNHPLGRLALQFRKYAQKTYYLLGKQMVAAAKGDKEAMKAFAGIMGTHFLAAGALGLPIEGIKAALTLSGIAGGPSYADFERKARQGVASLVGPAAGEIMTRGLPRYLGVDLSSRISLNGLFLNDEPKSAKPDDLRSWAFANFAGAPASMIIDWAQGASALAHGDVLEATRLMMPLKIYADTVQAYKLATEGKKSPSGKSYVDPVRLDQALVKALGFQPGEIAEQGEQARAVRNEQSQFNSARTTLINGWVNAEPAERAAQWHEIQKWNKDQPAAARVTYGQLVRALQRRKADSSNTVGHLSGIRFSKRDRHIAGENSFYNVQ